MKFLFDLDGTLTKQETLPLLAQELDLEDLSILTEATIKGDIPFQESFIKRVNIIKKQSITSVRHALRKVKFFEEILNFINENKDDCIIVSGNLDVWICELIKQIGCKAYTSEAFIQNNEIEKIKKILKKEDIVSDLKNQGETVVYIGDGNNDAEAMRLADISIASGLVHYPSKSVLENADYLVFNETSLLRLIKQIQSPRHGKSVVITSAGIGSRLGMSKTKAMIDFNGEKLINYQLGKFMNFFDDIRIVVGFEYKDVIDTVLQKTTDVIFVFNHNYFNTKTAKSLYLGSRHANEMILAWDGDLIVFPEDIKKCINSETEFAGCSRINSEDGVFVEHKSNKIIDFTSIPTDMEWSGPLMISREKIFDESKNVYDMLRTYLPFPIMEIRAFDIDTYSDYEHAKHCLNKWAQGNSNIDKYYSDLSNKIKDPVETRNKAPDFSSYDIKFIKKFADNNNDLLDLGAGAGLLINSLVGSFREITAVEKYEKFSDFISNSEQVVIINEDVLTFLPSKMYNLITAFGLMNFFSYKEAEAIYQMVFNGCKKSGKFIVKHQMGIREDVFIKGYSNELGCDYYSNYRWLENEKNLLRDIGFKISEVVDIYPPEFNRWDNTHFYAIVCTK
jgi:HAD superfamily phosphoserine phosphatase-like hydrolase